ncbi:hypothetical protein C0J52_09554 [Blattella germanica]|nr:hypothetical protein C0J52_09554 [Blattella germanica]
MANKMYIYLYASCVEMVISRCRVYFLNKHLRRQSELQVDVAEVHVFLSLYCAETNKIILYYDIYAILYYLYYIIIYYITYIIIYYIIYVKQGGTVESVESPYIQDTMKLDIIQSSHTKSPPEGMYKISDFTF